jgi:rhamnosyltransferase
MKPIPPTAGVVVTFHPDSEFEHRLRAIAQETPLVVVIDNSENVAVQERLAVICVSLGAEFIPNPSNLGMAAALNHAFARMADRGFRFCIAFDQDSVPAPGFAAALHAVRLNFSEAAVVGANWQDEATPGSSASHLRPHPRCPVLFSRIRPLENLGEVTCVITSGSLFELEIWRTLGGFDEALFLDLVDTDYCLRARNAGHPVSVAARASLSHRRGEKRPVIMLGRTWWPAFMPPLRLRYLFRNRLRLIPRHAMHAPHWVVFEMTYALKIGMEILFLEDRKGAKLWACLRGTWDAVAGRKGRIE